jgi:hypothetical protein
MKHIFVLLFITVINTTEARSQATYFSTNYTQECYWNTGTEKFDKCTGSDQSTMFKLNSEKTMFHHTTETISSDYFVTKKEYDKDNDVYTYDVKSDAGNTYFFIIDIKNSQIRIVGSNKSSNSLTYIHVFTIKKSWTE